MFRFQSYAVIGAIAIFELPPGALFSVPRYKDDLEFTLLLVLALARASTIAKPEVPVRRSLTTVFGFDRSAYYTL